MGLALLYSLNSAARALTSTALALHAYDLYKDIDPKSADSFVGLTYTAISLSSLLAALAAPFALRILGVRRSYRLANAIFILGMIALCTDSIPGVIGGLLGRALSGVLGSVCIILLIIHHIPKSDFVISESLRLLMGSIAWGAGPILGVFLFSSYGIAGLAAAAIGVHLLLAFSLQKMPIGDSEKPEDPPPANPFRMVQRFLGQRQMRLAWGIVFCRSSWWSMFFTYPALYLADRDLAVSWSGWLAGAGNLLLILSPLVRWLANRVGLKKPIVGAFWMNAAAMFILPFVYDSPALVAIILLMGASFVVILDSLGNIPFMRFARAKERQQMTPIFRTYVDAAELLPSALYAILLLFFDFRAVFIASGLIMLLGGLSATRLPGRL